MVASLRLAAPLLLLGSDSSIASGGGGSGSGGLSESALWSDARGRRLSP